MRVISSIEGDYIIYTNLY